MSENNNNKIWFDLRKSELNLNQQKFESEKKIRRSRELVLFITCLIGIIYFLPIDSIQGNETLEISALSVKLILIYALYIYPTLITILYILVISTALSQSQLMSLIIQGKKELIYFEVNNAIPNPQKYLDYKIGHRYLFLPSLLHSSFCTDSRIAINLGKVIFGFVGLVYFAFPFLCNYLLLSKLNSVAGNWPLLFWNLLSFSMMLITFLYAFFSIKYFKNQTA